MKIDRDAKIQKINIRFFNNKDLSEIIFNEQILTFKIVFSNFLFKNEIGYCTDSNFISLSDNFLVSEFIILSNELIKCKKMLNLYLEKAKLVDDVIIDVSELLNVDKEFFKQINKTSNVWFFYR